MVDVRERVRVLLRASSLPVYSFRRTSHNVVIYSPPVRVEARNGRRYLWCSSEALWLRPGGCEVVLKLPLHSIVKYYYRTGSRRWSYALYVGTFVAMPTPRYTVKIPNTAKKPKYGAAEIEIESLVPLKRIAPELIEYGNVRSSMELEGYSIDPRGKDVNVSAYIVLKLTTEGVQAPNERGVR